MATMRNVEVATDKPKSCTTKECDKPARCAILTNRPTRDKMYSTIFYDERTAPKKASPYCKDCAIHLTADLLRTLIDE